MPNCTNEPVGLGKVGRRVIEAAFDGGDIVSDGGGLLLRQVDQRWAHACCSTRVCRSPAPRQCHAQHARLEHEQRGLAAYC
jgi:hypothetical protein